MQFSGRIRNGNIIMREKISFFFQKLKLTIFPDVSRNVKNEIIRDNVYRLKKISAAVTAVEIVILTLFCVHYHFVLHYWRSLISALTCILVSLYITVHMTRVSRNEIILNKHLLRENVIIILYYGILVFWGMAASLRHYASGEQMLTFFIVEIVFTCFVTMPPLMSIALILSAHGIFFIALELEDGAARISFLNYLALALLLCAGMITRYHIEVRQIRQRIEVENLNKKLEILSMTDALTGIGNRMALRTVFQNYVGGQVAVMMADVDYFKRYNDEAGHEAGDQVLMCVASLLTRYFPRNCCFRYGGDEFLVLMKTDQSEEFQHRIDSWQDAVSAASVPGISVPIRCSAGFVVERVESEEELRRLVHKADRELYLVKETHHKSVRGRR